MRLTNYMRLFVKLHSYHRYVTGEGFMLHVKFEEFYNEAAAYIDELVERLLAVSGKPIATMKKYLNYSPIEEETNIETVLQMVEVLRKDYETVVQVSKDGVAVAKKNNDESIGDLLLAIYTTLGKHIWMLKAYLGNEQMYFSMIRLSKKVWRFFVCE